APHPSGLHPLSLHDALPISDQHTFDGLLGQRERPAERSHQINLVAGGQAAHPAGTCTVLGEHDLDGITVRAADRGAVDRERPAQDRKSTRLNSSHVSISYAV